MEASLEMVENLCPCLFRSPELSFGLHLGSFVEIEDFLALNWVVMLDYLDLMTFWGNFPVR